MNQLGLSERAIALVRSLRSVFAALDDHKIPSERQQIYDTIASHIRNASPMSLALPDPALAAVVESPPLNEVIVKLSDGARVEVRRLDGKINLYVHDALSHDADVGLSGESAEEVCRALTAVMGGV